MEKAKGVFDAYWEKNKAIKLVVKTLKVKTLPNGEMWQYNPISKFWYSLRTMNDQFSTLVQGSASYVFDLWVQKVLEKREQLTAQFHDEIVLCVKKGHREQAERLLRQSLDETNSELRLNRELDIGIQFGDRYSEIH